MKSWIALLLMPAAAMAAAAPHTADGHTATTVTVTRVADGLGSPEGPVWVPGVGLLLSDVSGKTIQRLKPEGGTETWLDAGIGTNGLILSNDGGKLLACCHSTLNFVEIDLATKAVSVRAKGWSDGRPFLNVNDVGVDAAGRVFFTDPTWKPIAGGRQGIVRLDPDGTTTLAAAMEKQPNGLVIDPARKRLIVARSGGPDLVWFAMEPDGSLKPGGTLHTFRKGDEPDGMTIDRQGNIYQALAGTGEVAVIDPAGRETLRFRAFDRFATNVEFEDGPTGDNRTLYVTGGATGGKKTGGVAKAVFSPAR